MSSVEVAVPKDSSTKDKGDLLENLIVELLRTQNYEVAKEVRVTASELDLLCQHKVNRRQIYVECKAHRNPLSVDVLKNLLGTITLKKYQEGWLVSTGPLGKDAKGFQHEWEMKATDEAQQLSIYTPERILEALSNAGVIHTPPQNRALELVNDADMLGDWSLLITPYGRYWIATTLVAGVPEGALVYSARTGKLIDDRQLLSRLAHTDTSLGSLDFDFVNKLLNKDFVFEEPRPVVEVQQGENWSDYRPARPEDFVGRKDEQVQILKFLEAVRIHESTTRVFAITGDSGMGKSSLIAKLRSRTGNLRYKKRVFLFAVDVRAATDPSYMYSALLAGLNEAARCGFGNRLPEVLRISNLTDPLSSPSIQSYLHTLEEREQVVCIVFDQFEELYSKIELFPIFEVAQNLLLMATSMRSNLVFGFAWKTDSTVHQNHPAYYFWHRLSDYRMELRLRRFTHSEAFSAITIFQKEIDTKLRSDLRRQLIENSQGYPWLLKKLSIHVYEQLRDGISQSEIMNKALDVESLFKRDLQQLTPSEGTCLKMIAKSAPADWYEVLESSDQETLRSLVQKRLIVRSGDRINLYWDIFREYVLTESVPSIPMTYLPTSPSLRTMLAVAQLLDHERLQSHEVLGKAVGISEKSVGNIVRDLVMFGIATGSQSQVALSDDVESSDPKVILRRLRKMLKNHALTISLFRYDIGSVLTTDNIIDSLHNINPAAQHQNKTWKIYAERIAQWLSATGFLEPTGEGWRLEDRGEESISPTNALIRHYYSRHPQRYRENTLFIGDTSPYRAVKALEWLLEQPPQHWAEIEKAGHRNGARTLLNLRLIKNEGGKYFVVASIAKDHEEMKSAVWNAALKEPAMELVISFLSENPTASGSEVGEIVASEYERDWTSASRERIGNSLRQWGAWLISGRQDLMILEPPGRRGKNTDNQRSQLPLFE
jgi:hypothetical protein